MRELSNSENFQSEGRLHIHMGRYHETEASMEKTGLKHIPHSVRRATKGHHGVCINGGQLLPDNHPQLHEHMLGQENKSISGRPKKSIHI